LLQEAGRQQIIYDPEIYASNTYYENHLLSRMDRLVVATVSIELLKRLPTMTTTTNFEKLFFSVQRSLSLLSE
jgi:hypothetical protein